MKIIAHRGNMVKYPENTIRAFDSAIECGADAIEFDVQEAAGGRLIIFHDYYLGRMVPGNSVISSLDFNEISALTINGEKIPELEPVISKYYPVSNISFEIELKGYTKSYADNVIKILKRFDIFERIEVTSPHSFILSYIKSNYPEIRIGAFIRAFPDWMKPELYESIIINNLLLDKIDVAHVPESMWSQSLFSKLKANSIIVHAADCDTREAVLMAIQLEADQLSTCDPLMAVETASRN